MAKIDIKSVINAANILRDARNWLAVFKIEYDIANEAYKVLHKKIESIGKSLSGISCTPRGIDANSVRTVANALRDTKAWLFVFAKEYDLSKETVKVLGKKLELFGSALAEIKCSKR